MDFWLSECERFAIEGFVLCATALVDRGTISESCATKMLEDWISANTAFSQLIAAEYGRACIQERLAECALASAANA